MTQKNKNDKESEVENIRPDLGIGEKIKALRKHNKLTLKQLSELTGFSIGFLSQVERGISSIAIDSLAHVLKVFNIELSNFFQQEPLDAGEGIMRSYEQRFFKSSPRIIESLLSYKVSEFNCLPRIYQLLPAEAEVAPPAESYIHEGEEILYILDGVLTLYLRGKVYSLFPGDCVQLHSSDPHNWENKTKCIVRFLQFNYPNPYAIK
jgi:transcriptional regulator with XRE-family HTH domain